MKIELNSIALYLYKPITKWNIKNNISEMIIAFCKILVTKKVM